MDTRDATKLARQLLHTYDNLCDCLGITADVRTYVATDYVTAKKLLLNLDKPPQCPQYSSATEHDDFTHVWTR